MDRNQRTALYGVGVIVGMAGLTAAAVPLYDWFCRATGYGGTTRMAGSAPVDVVDRLIEVRFNADVSPSLGWSFKPVERSMTVRLGEDRLAFYTARNLSDEPLVGTATFNVTPFDAGPHFWKVQCFCFEEQVLMPGETAEMPVSFYVDPALLDDPNAADLTTITLSYTFFRADEATRALAEQLAAAANES